MQKLQQQDAKIDAIYASVESMRKYIKWTAIVSLVLFVLPLLGILLALPSLISTLTAGQSLGI